MSVHKVLVTDRINERPQTLFCSVALKDKKKKKKGEKDERSDLMSTVVYLYIPHKILNMIVYVI